MPIILVDNEKICLNNCSLARLSELCGFDKARYFAERLQKENMLLTDGKLQKKVAIPMAGKSENMYCIDLDKLFEFGEQRIETDEFSCVSPEIQLCLGKSTAGNPVYFKQCESFCSFRSANATDTLKLMGFEKNPAAWQCLNSLETGQVIVTTVVGKTWWVHRRTVLLYEYNPGIFPQSPIFLLAHRTIACIFSAASWFLEVALCNFLIFLVMLFTNGRGYSLNQLRHYTC